MVDKTMRDSAPTTFAKYQITVKGAFSEDWKDWFNGMLVSAEHVSEGGSYTTLTCRIRDQAELMGILNWLHSLNLAFLNIRRLDE